MTQKPNIHNKTQNTGCGSSYEEEGAPIIVPHPVDIIGVTESYHCQDPCRVDNFGEWADC